MLEELRHREADRSGLEIILINVWEGVNAKEEADRFCEVWDIAGPVLLDESGEYARLLGVKGVPTNIFVDADGTVRSVGAITEDELRVAVDDLLGR